MSRGLSPLLRLGWLASLQHMQEHMRGRVVVAIQAGTILLIHLLFHALMH